MSRLKHCITNTVRLDGKRRLFPLVLQSSLRQSLLQKDCFVIPTVANWIQLMESQKSYGRELSRK